ncbi:MAG: hypothetical protein WC099_00140 [Candidatus Paceibacterota bacterium]
MEMVSQVVIYLSKTFVFRVGVFFRHWYVDGFFAFYGVWMRFLRMCERKLAIRINVRFLFQPLYQERNIVGYVLGFLYRFIKILFGGILYVGTGIVTFGIYIVWALFPAILIYRGIFGS